MDKFSYGSYSSSISDIVYSATNGYSNPTSELETRKQFSTPLKEVKDYINNTVPIQYGTNKAVQLLVTTDNKLQYRLEPNGTRYNIGGGVDIGTIYPIGSIYMSVNNTDPSTLFTGTTWEQLKDRFLLGAGDTYSAGSTGGEASHTLTVEEMPAHSHQYAKPVQTWTNGGDYSSCYIDGNANTNTVGGGQAHNNMPPYLTVYMWKRTA